MKKLYQPSNLLDALTLGLAALGAINWGLGRLFDIHPVRSALRGSKTAEKGLYGAVGLSGLWLSLRLVGSVIGSAVAVAVPQKPQEKTVYPVAHTVVGMRLPELHGETLSWKHITLPDDAHGKVALLVMGYSYDSRWGVQTWTRAFQQRFGHRPDATFFEMPMIRGLARLATHYIELGMQHAVPTTMWDHVLTVYGPTSRIRNSLGATMSSDIWVYLIDRDGVIRFECAGKYDPMLFEELSTATEIALGLKSGYRIDVAE